MLSWVEPVLMLNHIDHATQLFLPNSICMCSLSTVYLVCILLQLYLLPRILTAVLHDALPDKRCLSHRMCLYQVMMTLHFLNDVANDAESI